MKHHSGLLISICRSFAYLFLPFFSSDKKQNDVLCFNLLSKHVSKHNKNKFNDSLLPLPTWTGLSSPHLNLPDVLIYSDCLLWHLGVLFWKWSLLTFRDSYRLFSPSFVQSYELGWFQEFLYAFWFSCCYWISNSQLHLIIKKERSSTLQNFLSINVAPFR